jgi:hypothetical protein
VFGLRTLRCTCPAARILRSSLYVPCGHFFSVPCGARTLRSVLCSDTYPAVLPLRTLQFFFQRTLQSAVLGLRTLRWCVLCGPPSTYPPVFFSQRTLRSVPCSVWLAYPAVLPLRTLFSAYPAVRTLQCLVYVPLRVPCGTYPASAYPPVSYVPCSFLHTLRLRTTFT